MFNRDWRKLLRADRRSKDNRSTKQAESTALPTNQVLPCPNCTSVDVCTFLQDEQFYRTHSTWSEALSNTECPFCQFVVSSFKNDYINLEKDDRNTLFCRLERYASNETQYRKGNREHSVELQLAITIVHECPDNSCSSGCHRINTKPSENRIIMDVLDIPAPISAHFKRPFLVRKALDPAFNTGLLLDWLKESETGELQQRPPVTISLDPLLRAKRFRVLDIQSRQIVTLQSQARYVALSYVWGNVRQAIDDSTTTVDMQQLPWTIQDTIELVKRIGERYLWVDSLCIHQHDLGDKAVVIPQMAAVYGNAYFTVIAADGPDANARLTRLLGAQEPEELVTMMTRKGPVRLVARRSRCDVLLAGCRWSQRGWTLQERLLSRRCLFFTESGVFFDSKALHACEAYELILDSTAAHDAHQPYEPPEAERFSSFRSTLRQYTMRELAYRGDRWDAFNGILRQLEPQIATPETIDALSGLPSQDFVASLLWYQLPSMLVERRPIKMTRLHMDTRGSRYFPSWSWIGWEGPIGLDLEDMYMPTRLHRLVSNLRALPEPNVIDAANIVCHTPYSPSDFLPELGTVMKPLQVIVHLWAKTWPCSLVPKAQRSNDIVYAVEPQGLMDEAPMYEGKENAVILPDDVAPDSTFKLLCLHDSTEYFILVREVESFYERVDIIKYENLTENSSQEMPVEYIRLR